MVPVKRSQSLSWHLTCASMRVTAPMCANVHQACTQDIIYAPVSVSCPVTMQGPGLNIVQDTTTAHNIRPQHWSSYHNQHSGLNPPNERKSKEVKVFLVIQGWQTVVVIQDFDTKYQANQNSKITNFYFNVIIGYKERFSLALS